MNRFYPAALALAAALLLASHGLGQTNWPHFRFDDRQTGFQKDENIIDRSNVRSTSLAWRDILSTGPRAAVDYSSAAVVDGVVYIADGSGVLWAYDADGCGQSDCSTPLWSSTSLAQIVDSPAVANGIVYVGSQTDDNNNDGKLNAFSVNGCGAPSCAPLWQGDAGSDSILMSSPTVWKGRVFVGSFGGTLYAFNADGCGQALCQPVWTAQTGGPIESTPTVHKGVLFVGSNDGKLYAFKAKGCRRKTCKPIWTGDSGGTIFESTPAISGGLVFINSQHTLSAFAEGGCGTSHCQPVWQAVDNLNFFSGSPAVAHGRVYQPWESGIAVYKAKGCGQPVCDKVWSLFGSGAQASVSSSPTIANGLVFAGRNTGEILAWIADSCGNKSCSEIWKGRLDDQLVTSSPTVVNGKIYIGGSTAGFGGDTTGILYVFRPQ